MRDIERRIRRLETAHNVDNQHNYVLLFEGEDLVTKLKRLGLSPENNIQVLQIEFVDPGQSHHA